MRVEISIRSFLSKVVSKLPKGKKAQCHHPLDVVQWCRLFICHAPSVFNGMGETRRLSQEIIWNDDMVIAQGHRHLSVDILKEYNRFFEFFDVQFFSVSR